MSEAQALPDEPPATAPSAVALPVSPEAPASPAIPELSPAACAARLAELFPALFTLGAAKPLKLRIQSDIQQRTPGIFTKKSLSIFLHRYTTNTAYLRAIVAAPERVDLDGQPAGALAAEHREAASAELERRRAMHEERRVAERNAQRDAHRAEHDAARHAYAAEQELRREASAMLRAFETTTLTRANFCALKGLTEVQLEALLTQARQAPPQPERADNRPADRGPRPPERPEARQRPHPPRRPSREGR